MIILWLFVFLAMLPAALRGAWMLFKGLAVLAVVLGALAILGSNV
jgi:hypothetical protein